MNALPRPLAGMAELDDRGPVPVAVFAVGLHAGSVVYAVVDRFGLVDTVSEGHLRITDETLQAVAARAEQLAEAVPA